MPELNNTFVKGRMNKDLDDRLVPQGEYRDALNIEVSTSESSDVGTVQNLKGNKNISNDILSSFNHENIFNLKGNIEVNIQDTYTSFQNLNHTDNAGVAFSANNSIKFSYLNSSSTSYRVVKNELLEVDKEYTIYFDFDLNLRSYANGTYSYTVGVVGIDNALFTDEIVIDKNTITNDGIASGYVSKTFYCDNVNLGIFASTNFSGSIKNITLTESSTLVSDTNNAITVGSTVDTASDTIYNFVHKASDFKINTFITSTGEVKSRMLGIQSDAIIQHKPNNFEESSVNKVVLADVYKVRIGPKIGVNGKLPMISLDGIIENTKITGLPCITNYNGEKVVQGIRPGMKVSLLNEHGQNGWSGFDISVKEIEYDEDTKSGLIHISPVPSNLIFNQDALDKNFILEFNSERVLKFSPGTTEVESNTSNGSSQTPISSSITSINVVDNFLYYTDNNTEPKKINIKRAIESTNSIFEHTKYTEINTSNPTTYFLEEKYISVIKAKPTYFPRLRMSNDSRKGGGLISIGPDKLSSHYYSDFSTSIIGENSNGISTQFNFVNEDGSETTGSVYRIISGVKKVNWREGDTLLLKGIESEKTVDVLITKAYESGNYDNFDVKLIGYSEEYIALDPAPDENFVAELKSSKKIYENNFISFALRYKYNDNEYSAIGPYSEPAFLPGRYLYKSSVGLNESMVNNLESLDIYDIIRSDVSKEVKSIDIILKDHLSTNAYLIKSIYKNSSEWNLNSFEVLSELRGTTIPSLQLSRIYDAVPVKAKAQEFIASRLMYGNYSEAYDMIDDSMSKIDFSCATSFETINSLSNEFLIASVNTGDDNNLIATNNPFFNPEDSYSADRYIHNFYRGLTDTFTNDYSLASYGTEDYNGDAVTLHCPQDIDQLFRVNGEPGTGPEFNSFLIPIFPVNSHQNGNESTTLIMPNIVDKGDAWNMGGSGNYQVFSTTHSDHYNSAPIDSSWGSANLNENVKPLIYKVPTSGVYRIKASTEAIVRYYYGNINSMPLNIEQNVSQIYKNQPFRIELHKVNASGVSQGIINNSIDLIGDNNGLAVSPLRTSNLAVSNINSFTGIVGSPFGPDTLLQTRNGFLTFNESIPIIGGTTTPSPQSQEVELYREVTLTADEYIAVFFSYQKSFDTNTAINTSSVEHVIFDYVGVTADTSSYNIDSVPSIRFLLDADKTKLEINAPQVINDIAVESPSKSVRSNRFYETGVVYSDMYGRDTTVMISKNSKIEIPISYSDKKNAICCEIKSKAPYWATHYKYYIKESSNKYYNMVLDGAYGNEGTEDNPIYYWLSFNSSDISKVKIDDNLILKKQHGSNTAVNSKVNKIKVLDISTDAPPTSVDLQDSQKEGKFFVKVKTSEISNITSVSPSSEEFADALVDHDTVFNSDNGAVFEVEPESTVREGFYWESSKAYPIVLNEENAEQYIEIGDNVQLLYRYDSDTDTFTKSSAISQWNENNANAKVIEVKGATSFPNKFSQFYDELDSTCNITINTNTRPYVDGPTTSIYIPHASHSEQIIAKFTKSDGSYVTGRVLFIENNLIRIAPHTHPNSKTPLNIINKIVLPWFNCYQWFNGVETDIIRDDFGGSTIYAYTPETGKQSGFNASDYYPNYGRVNNTSDIIWSQIYNEASNIDASNQFILADKTTKRLNRSHGQINALIARNNDIIALCEDKILKILSSGKDALFNADGNIQLTASSNVLGQSIPFVGDFGCQHPESIALDEYRVYFTDKARGAVLRLSRDGITEISNNGMDNWFDEQLERAQSIVGSFDDSKSEYNITIHEVISPRVSKNVYTLSFDESTKGWTSFKSFIKESGLSLNNKYYTFKKGRLYRHHSDDVLRNYFYDNQYESSVTTLINMQPNIVKSFYTINYEGSQAEIVKDLTDEKYTNIKGVSGWSVEDIKTDQQEGEVDEFVEKEGKWFNNIKGK